MRSSKTRKQVLKNIWSAAIDAVAGKPAVIHAIEQDDPFSPDLILAVGKAAAGMCVGALEKYPDCPALVVTKYDHADASLKDNENVQLIEAGHPIPDQSSLKAGDALLERMREMPTNSRVLLLVSGGASALAEALPDGVSLDDLRSKTDKMIAGGKTIAEINTLRKQRSLIKDGKLIEAFCGAELRVYAISDVEGDSIQTIGSGIGDCRCAKTKATSKIIACNRIARDQAECRARELGYEVRLNEETLYGDVFDLAAKIGALLDSAEPGIYLWGGEPTIVLPSNPGRGGRNQSLALALSEHISGRNHVSLLVAGTDGTDGPTDAAGGLVDGGTWDNPESARDALKRANAGVYLESHGGLLATGPTNTNVMDLAIAVVDV